MTSNLLERGRLTQRLAEAARFPIAVIHGAAGSGKSIALSDFLSYFDQPYVAYDVTPEHRTFAGFVRGFADAVGERAPGARLSFGSAYQRAVQSREPARDLAAWLYEHLKPLQATFVLDHLHNDEADPRSRAFLAHLIEAGAEHSRWILSCRSAETFPLATWMAFRRMDVPIDERDLAFTRGDIAALAERLRVPLTARECAHTFERTGGWATGVGFLLHGGRALFDQSEQVRAFEPLIERALSECDSWEIRALLSTCYLPDLSPALLASLGDSAAVDAVAKLRERAPYLFVGTGGAIRFHDVLAEALAIRLAAADPRESAAAVSIAGHALRRGGRLDEALALYTQAGAAEPAMALLEHHGVELVEQGHAETIERALSCGQAAGLVQSPIALALRAIAESRLGRFDTAESWFNQALARASGNDDVTMIEIKYLYACDLMLRNRPDCVALFRAHANDDELPVDLQASFLSALAQASMLFDEPGARECILRALSLSDLAGSDATKARVRARAAYVFLYLNEHGEARRWGTIAAEAAVRASMFSVATGAFSVLYAIADDAEEPREALAHLDSLLENGLKAGNLQFQFYFLACSLDIEAERGNLPPLARIDAALQSFDVHHDEATSTETLLPAHALRATWRGKFDHAYNLLAPTAAAQVGADRVALRWSTVALYAAAALRPREAREALDHCFASLEGIEETSNRCRRAELFAALALCLTGRSGEAGDIVRAMRDSAVLPARIRALLEAVTALRDRYRGERNHLAVERALRALDDDDFGGIARLFEALPLHTVFADRVARLNPRARALLQDLVEAGAPESADDELARLCDDLDCASIEGMRDLTIRTGALHVPPAQEEVFA